MPSEECPESEDVQHPIDFDRNGRLIVNGRDLATKLRALLKSGRLEIVLKPSSGPMRTGLCILPPKPVPPVIDCGGERFHLRVER